jgi:phage gp36-like protein
MSNYVTFEKLSGLIPSGWLTAGLDDDTDPDAEKFDVVAGLADDEVDGVLSLRYPTPVVPTPDIVKTISLYIAAAIVYGRRGMSDKFPYADATDRYRKMLNDIGSGKIPLSPEAQRTRAGVEIIGETNIMHSDRLNA